MYEQISSYLGSQWLQNLLNTAPDKGRLQRGQEYHHQGRVADVVIDSTGRAKSQVEGGYSIYETSIKWPALRAQDQIQLRRLASQPQELHRYITSAAGRDLLPQDWDSMTCRCTCPDWAIPCKHMVALALELSQELRGSWELVWWLWGMDAPTEAGSEHTTTYLEPDTSSPLQKAPALLSVPWSEPSWWQCLPDQPAFYRRRNLKNELKETLQQAAQAAAAPSVTVSQPPAGPVKLFALQSQFLLDTADHPGSLEPHMQIGAAAWFGSTADLLIFTFADGQELDRTWRFLGCVLKFARWLAASGCFTAQYRQQGRQGQVHLGPSPTDPAAAQYMAYLHAIYPEGMAESVQGQPLQAAAVIEPLLHTLLGRWLWQGRPQARIAQGAAALYYGEVIVHDPRLQSWLAAAELATLPGQAAVKIDDTHGDGFLLQIGVLLEDQPFLPMPDFLTHRRWQSYGPAMQSLVEPVLMENQYLQRCLDDGLWETRLSGKQLSRFLKSCPPLLEQHKLALLLPKAMQQLVKPKVVVQAASQKKPGKLGLDSLVRFSWQAALGDQVLSTAEFSELARWGEGIVRFRDHYVELDAQGMEQLNRHLQKSELQQTAYESLGILLQEELEGTPVRLDKGSHELLQALGDIKPVPLPQGLDAQLRPYQLRGYQWLTAQTQWGLGLCLADDMGLGKTVQAAAWIQYQKEQGLLTLPVLIICPTTLLANWAKELERFTPQLDVLVYHGSTRTYRRSDVLITSYGLVRTDKHLGSQTWHAVILDEAQNIKNPSTHQTKAVKALKSQHRLALTGTPVENSLMELWSIFDFLNPGLLGSRQEFWEKTARPIETRNNTKKAEQLQRIVGPFLMRRMKTDKNVIADLPDKLSLDEYVYLQPEQAALYHAAVHAFKNEELPDGGLARHRMVFQMLTRLKQICNHPAQYLKQGSQEAKRSGKALRLLELLRSVLGSGEQALIFTQYRQMGRILAAMLAHNLREEPLFFHGGLTAKERSRLVDTFQSGTTPLMIVSLKAGGSGLNLTAASHVVHYDLWWNPAVENQATDRAYRIGQNKNVMVHRLITRHTFEERIDEMIKAKQAVADTVITAGERWLSQLTDAELRELFSSPDG